MRKLTCLSILLFAAAASADDNDKVQTAAQRTRSVNNLKMIGLAMHSYHDKFGSFPTAAIHDKDGKPLLSWRVAILPFLDQEELYKQFKLDEPWDSEHNKKLLERMPKVYAPVRAQKDKKYDTFYRVFHGEGALFEGNKRIRLFDVTDGTSNTILVVEAGEAAPWTKPDELAFDASKDLPKLGGLFDGNFNALIADGSVRYFNKSADKGILKKLITRAGGEVIQP